MSDPSSNLGDFNRVLHGGLDQFSLFMLMRLEAQLGTQKPETPHYVQLSITIEVNAPSLFHAKERVADFIEKELPWHHDGYTICPLDPPVGWDSA